MRRLPFSLLPDGAGTFRWRLPLALGGSLLAHAALLFGTELIDLDFKPKAELQRLDATLVRPAPAAKVQPTPVPPPKAKPKPPAQQKAAVQPPRKEPEKAAEENTAEPPKPVEPTLTAKEEAPDQAAALEAEPKGADSAAVAAPALTAPEVTSWPEAGRITYGVAMGEQRFEMGQSTHVWEVIDGQYRLRATTEPTGIAAIPWFKPDTVVWESRGRITEKGLTPEVFVEKKSTRGVTGLAEVDRAANTLTHGRVHPMPVPEKLQDIFSIFYQLGYTGIGASAPQREFAVTNGRKVEFYRFEEVGVQDLALPFGQTWRTLHVRARYGEQEVTEVWVALERFGLPVQIRLVDKKGVVYYMLAKDVMVAKSAVAEAGAAGASGASGVAAHTAAVPASSGQ